MAELVDATDLKSVIRKDVGVRVPPRAHIKLNLKLGKYLLTRLKLLSTYFEKKYKNSSQLFGQYHKMKLAKNPYS